ncbi:chemotaxis protein CheW [Rhizobium chutanense]|uniref:Chemotaxis protein CheW n=1 Tax=Rhizobium chutanense TaxID=2035448 RepID=A0A2A6J7S9_9HYPH|nr:chemotaxis protein CheW [Rhizobium chutanense]PDT02051.1 chemotaxis protein CheW [Rhizobium chutanense]RUM07451.1 purine-binding chemotaxis protein CheW [Rhizobium chutanense]
MALPSSAISVGSDTLEIIAFGLHGQEFCVTTTTIREIRGWSPSTPVPHAPSEILGVINLRGSVIPIIDLALKLGMAATAPNEHSAIVVADVHGMVLGLLVDQVSDILSVRGDQIQPIPEIATSFDHGFSDGVITHESGMICFLNLSRMFPPSEMHNFAA